LTATKEELIERIRNAFDPIQSFTMTVDMAASSGALYTGEVTDYATIGGYVLFQRPGDIRIIGTAPVIQTTLFDMASMGAEFRIYIPSKNRFMVGREDVPGTSKSQLENLRPEAFRTALLVRPPDPATETTLLEDDTDETKAVYILLIVRRDQDQLTLVRNVYFERHSLEIVGQKTFEPSGKVLSETKYTGWHDFGGTSFPSDIDIERPQEGFEVRLTVLTMRVNSAPTADKFVLEQPQDVQVEELK